MIIFLYGKDTYLLQRKLKEIEQRYRKVHGNALNLEKLDALQVDFRGFFDALKQQSMFIKKKLFFLENVFSNEDFKKELLKHLEAISKPEDIMVLIAKEEPSRSDKLFQALQKVASCQGFEILTGLKLRNWVKREFAGYGAEIDSYALNQLICFIGQDLWQLSNEVKKLASYTKRVTAREVGLLVKPKIPAEIFKTIDALAQGNKKAALAMLQAHLDKGERPLYLLKMFIWQFRNLLVVKAGGRPKGMHPFVFKKTTILAQRFSLEELKRIYHQIFQVDLNIKTGRTLAEESLKMLIASI